LHNEALATSSFAHPFGQGEAQRMISAYLACISPIRVEFGTGVQRFRVILTKGYFRVKQKQIQVFLDRFPESVTLSELFAIYNFIMDSLLRFWSCDSIQNMAKSQYKGDLLSTCLFLPV